MLWKKERKKERQKERKIRYKHSNPDGTCSIDLDS